MANPGELTHKLHKLDDRSAYELMEELRQHLGISEPIRIRVLNNFEYTEAQLPKGSIEIGKHLINQMIVNGQVTDLGSTVHVAAIFQRFPQDKPDVVDKDFDYVVFQFGNESGAWGTNTEKLLKTIEIVASRDVAIIPTESSDSETLRTLILSQDAAHKRMIADLHESITEIGKRRAALEEEAARIAQERKDAHEAAQRELDEQKAALERQSYMATRRKIGQAIHKIMTDPDRETSRNQIRRSTFALFVFAAYMALGSAGAFGTYLSFVAYSDERSVELAEQRLKQMVLEDKQIQVLLDRMAALMPDPKFQESSEAASSVDGQANSSSTEELTSEPEIFIPRELYLDMSASKWILLAKLLLSSIVTIFGFVAAATWMRKHLDNETRLAEEKIAFIADVERASWVIEAIHEVKNEAGAELPKEWVDAVTRNLFAPKQAASDLDEGTQAIRALLGLAANAKVGPQGLEVELNRKGAKALGDAG